MDISIINSLMQDGRKSFRQISREINISAPTVEHRFNRMKKLGIIKDILPLFDIEKIENVLIGLVYLKINPSKLSSIIENIIPIPEVKSIFNITGEYNLVIKLIAKDIDQMNEIINDNLSSMEGIRSLSFQIVTKIIKDDPTFTINESQSLKAKCVYCYNEIKNHSRSIRMNNSDNYFCCNSCLALYNKKYPMN